MPFGPYPGWGGRVDDPFAPDVGTQEVPWWYGAYNWMQMLNDPAFWVPPDRMNQPAPGTWDNPQPQQPQQPTQPAGGTSFVEPTAPQPGIEDIPGQIDWTNLNVLWPWGWNDTKIGEQPQLDENGNPVYTTTTVGGPAGLAGAIGGAAGAALAGAAAAGAFSGAENAGGTGGTSPGFDWRWDFPDVSYETAPMPTTLDPLSNPNPPQVLNYDWAPQPTKLDQPPEPTKEPTKPSTPQIPNVPIPTGGGGGGAPMPVGNFPVVGGGPLLQSVFVPGMPPQVQIMSLGQLLAGGLPYAR